MGDAATKADEFGRRYPGVVILPYEGARPDIAANVFHAPTAVVIGNAPICGRSEG